MALGWWFIGAELGCLIVFAHLILSEIKHIGQRLDGKHLRSNPVKRGKA